MRCTKAGITINGLHARSRLGAAGFVERLTEISRGRAFFTTREPR
ncbi:MAG: hypothetical protein R2710_02605 [Acidimicrobiales bacterium]